jgi:hypothetical protein
MAYEPGTYLKQLRVDHKAGDHKSIMHEYCDICIDRRRKFNKDHDSGKHVNNYIEQCDACYLKEDT